MRRKHLVAVVAGCAAIAALTVATMAWATGKPTAKPPAAETFHAGVVHVKLGPKVLATRARMAKALAGVELANPTFRLGPVAGGPRGPRGPSGAAWATGAARAAGTTGTAGGAGACGSHERAGVFLRRQRRAER